MIKLKWSYLRWGPACLPALACLVLVAGCPLPPLPECTTDADCEEGQVCQDGVCVSAPECETDADCDEGQVCEDGACVEAPLGPADFFPTSLHDADFKGMEYFYSADNGGFETLTGVAYEELGCRVCHDASRFENADPPVDWPGTESCANCHANLDDPSEGITDDLCLGCHSRQKAEQSYFTDVHRDAGFTCMSCHTTDEMHGDGNEYNSIHESPSPACEGCHAEGEQAGAPPTNTAHMIHTATVDCSGCHVESVLTCYNCHFDSELAGGPKRAQSKRHGFKMLVQHDGKIHPATFQTLVGEQQSFYVVAPYYAHSITNSPQCDDCHGSAAVAEYGDTGQIAVAQWDDVARDLVGLTGVIPIPPDWETALLFDFLDYTGDPTAADTDPESWQFLKTGADLTQMLFGEPLTEEQMAKLSLPVGG